MKAIVCVSISYDTALNPAGTQRNDNVIMTSKRRHDVYWLCE